MLIYGSATVLNFAMQTGLNPLNPLQGKIRTSFMNKDGSASLPLFIVLLRP